MDERGLVHQTSLSLRDDGEASWSLGADSRAAGSEWFSMLTKYQAPPATKLTTRSAPSDPTFADVLLSHGFLSVEGWDFEVARREQVRRGHR